MGDIEGLAAEYERDLEAAGYENDEETKELSRRLAIAFHATMLMCAAGCEEIQFGIRVPDKYKNFVDAWMLDIAERAANALDS